MRKIVVMGAGRVGRVIGAILSVEREYEIVLADSDQASLGQLVGPVRGTVVDITDAEGVDRLLNGATAVVSALPYHRTELVAKATLAAGASYFDLTEDVEATRRVRSLATQLGPGQVCAPQCGLAPGFVSIAASNLMKTFEETESLQLRVGALPTYPTNWLKYNLTWSSEGLINQYCNPCESIRDGQLKSVPALEDLERITLDGVEYEAFNTSGGCGSLCESFVGRVNSLSYKSIRYPGHRDLIRFLLVELRLKQRRDVLRDIFEAALPGTFQDVVIVFVYAVGRVNGRRIERVDVRKIYSGNYFGVDCSGIQIATAASVSAMVDLHLTGQLGRAGLIRQEGVDLNRFLANRFGSVYTTPARSHGISGISAVRPHD